jgi:hypothetical protein
LPARGVCPQGCWPERGPSGNIICVCEYGAKRTLLRGVNGVGDVAGGVILAGLILVGLVAFAGTRSGARREEGDHRARLRKQVSFKGLRGLFRRRRRR